MSIYVHAYIYTYVHTYTCYVSLDRDPTVQMCRARFNQDRYNPLN